MKNRRIQGIIWFFAVMSFLTAMFTLAYFLTDWIYLFIGHRPSPVVIQLINSIGGLLLTGLIVSLLTRIFRGKLEDGRVQLFVPIIDALQRMAKGDFSVRVDKSFQGGGSPDNNIISDLIDSVNQAAVELNQMEQMRQEFISNVSHEIQSPLTSIRGFAQALQNNHLNADERKHYLNIIETESTRLSRITENLLKLASLESEHVKFEPKPYRLDKQIRDLILACEPQWSAKNIDMDVSLDELTVTADEDLLSQVWINLLHNSIKFTPENGKIGVALCREAENLRFEIRDTGIGIADEHQAHIFERFYKADKSRTRSNNGGSGLGLSIAQKIVRMHNGTITAESKVGVGTRFMVVMPA